MQMRGVEKQGAVTVTTSYTGAYEDESLRQEFFQSVK
jgi:GTP cyclohydrolase I